MVDPLIAPETQRLAEDNNVEWRVLKGSGEGGEVLERDVLAYLTRVMLGEEAADPTPEPLPEGLSAWPEEPARRGRADDLFTASLSSIAVPKPEPEPSPWQFDAPQTPAEPESAAGSFAFERGESEQGEGAEEAPAEAQWGWALEVENPPPDARHSAEAAEPAVWAVPLASDAPSPEGAVLEPLQGGVPEAVYQEALTEIQALRARLATLEEERLRHVSELHQLSRMQETIALQKDQGSKLGAAQSEVQRLKAELAAARGEVQRVAALEAKNRDLEARLTRARTFRTNAKAEYERLLADNMMLEHEAANLKKRRGFKLWGK